MNKWAKWGLIGLALWYLSQNPAGAGQIGRTAGKVVSGVANGTAQLVNGIAPGLSR